MSPGFESIFDRSDPLGNAVAERAPDRSLSRCDCWDCVDRECSSACEVKDWD